MHGEFFKPLAAFGLPGRPPRSRDESEDLPQRCSADASGIGLSLYESNHPNVKGCSLLCGLVLVLLVLMAPVPAHAALRGDTLRLPEAVVKSAPVPKGRHLSEKDSTTAGFFPSLMAGSLLEMRTGLQLRSYGVSSMQTISVRGAPARHTRVLWNDLELNSPTLGTFDFSTFNGSIMTEFSLMAGQSGLLQDGGAIGGTVLFSSEFADTSGLTCSGLIGGLGTIAPSLSASLASKRWRHSLRMEFFSAVNEFAFDNYTVAPMSRDTMRQADFFRTGVLAGSSFRIDSANTLEFWAWVNFMERALPGTLLSELPPGTFQKDLMRRLSVKWYRKTAKSEHSVTLGRMHDFQHYHAQFDSRITAIRDQVVHRMNGIVGRFRLSSLTRINLEEAFSDGFPEGVARFTGVQVLSVSRALGRFFSAEVSLSEFLAGNQVDILRPSAGLEFQRKSIRTFANHSLTSRFPGLNDVYWIPGGNTSLRPERSRMSEVGFDWKKNLKKSRIFNQIQISGTGHHGLITDMILWQPTGAFWSAFNIQNVQLRGAEWQTTFRNSTEYWSWELYGVYAYTESIDRATGLMLPYVAKHAARGSFCLSYKGLASAVNVRHNGERPVGMLFMTPHTVADLSVTKVFSLHSTKMTTGLSVINLTDTNYQVMAYMPMPGRHAMLNLSISW